MLGLGTNRQPVLLLLLLLEPPSPAVLTCDEVHKQSHPCHAQGQASQDVEDRAERRDGKQGQTQEALCVGSFRTDQTGPLM